MPRRARQRQGDSIVKIRSLHTSLVGVALACIASVLLAGCGGGGAQGNPDTAGFLQIVPATGTLYAGVPATFQVQGGRTPYTLTSTEPSLLPVPATLDGHSFDVLPANPGVIDANLPPGSLPVRTVTIQVRSGDGQNATSTIKVGQNFLLGYGLDFTPSTCPTVNGAPSSGLSGACAGGQTAVQFRAIINGNLYGGRQYQLTVERGPFQFVFPQSGVVGNTITITTDHVGTGSAIIQVNASVPSQIAVLRITDVATGVYADQAFVINGSGPNAALTAIPNAITLTGPDSATCGAGTSNVLAFDGVPPYTASSSNPAISVTPVSGSNPGQFAITVPSGPPPCASGTITITDSVGNRTTVTVASAPGTATPPAVANPILIVPNSITLGCGQSGSVSVLGGGTTAKPASTFFVSSVNSSIVPAVTGNTLSITRTPTGTAPATATVIVTDGTQVATVTVSSPTTCP